MRALQTKRAGAVQSGGKFFCAEKCEQADASFYNVYGHFVCACVKKQMQK
jgi:hypothetical protein